MYIWKFLHNFLVHGLLMSWPWEPEWVQRAHSWTATQLAPSSRKLTVVQKVDIYFAQADNHTWASGKSVDEAIGNWFRTNQRTEGFSVTIYYDEPKTHQQKEER